MGKAKKWIAGIVTIALIAGGAYKGADYLRTRNQPEAVVVDLSELIVEDYDDYDTDESSLSGSIATNVIQNIKIDKDVIVGSLPVQLGDEVKKGDLLMTIDTTITQMELGLQDLRLQQYQQDLKKAQDRLYSLQHGGPIDEPSSSDGTDSTDSTESMDNSSDSSGSDSSPILIGAAGVSGSSAFLASAFPSILAAELLSDGDIGELELPLEEEAVQGTDWIPDIMPEQEETNLEPEDSWVIDEIIAEDEADELVIEDDGDSELIDDVTEDDTELIEDITEEIEDEIPDSSGEIITPTPEQQEKDGDVFYSVLDYDSVPYEGDGSRKYPYVFFVSYDNEDEGVTLTGAFKNRMLGYNADGTELLHEGGYWYRLEFHWDDTVEDYDDRTLSLRGYYVINGGGDIEEPVDPEETFFLSLADADQYTEDEEEEEEWEEEPYMDEDYGDSDNGSTEASMTRDEAIKAKEEEIKLLEYNIKSGEVELRKLQKRCEITEIYARIDGTVDYAGNPDAGTGSMESFLRVKSEEGYFVRGSVSEMLLDQIGTGTVLRCTTDFGETFDAEVIDVTEYPEDSSSGDSFYYGGNPNASTYSFTASIEDQSLDISEDTYLVSVVLPSAEEQKDKGITINKAFVRSENGQSYVMKDDGGVLKKQYVQVGKVDSYGYSITISKGLRRSDKLAFPYSENAVEGTKTKEGTMDDLYDYTDSLF